MEEVEISQLGRAGTALAGEIGYEQGYAKGVEDALYEVGDFIDEYTLDEIKEQLLGGKEWKTI